MHLHLRTASYTAYLASILLQGDSGASKGGQTQAECRTDHFLSS